MGLLSRYLLQMINLLTFFKIKDERQLSSLELSEVIENSYREIFTLLKNELKHHNLDGIIKSGLVLCGGGSEVQSIVELARDFFSRRVKIGQIQRSRSFWLRNNSH